MAFHVVHRDNRAVPGEPQPVGHATPDHQGAHQSGTRRVGDGVGFVDARLAHNLLN